MPKLIAIIDQDGLSSLVVRPGRLQQQLEEIATERDKIRAQRITQKNKEEKDQKDDIEDGFETQFAACHQLFAVLEFFEDSERLMPELHKLKWALLDLESGRRVKWLRPAPQKKKGQPPPPAEEGALHGRYAAVMNWLMEEAGKSKEEAAEFVVKYGGIRNLMRDSPRAQKAFHPWNTVANWRDRVIGSYDPSRAAEHAGFEAMYEVIRERAFKGADAGVEVGAKNLLRVLKNLS
jgi:hypothetical protein